MNERIDELAWQAGCNKTSRYDPDFPDGNGWIINQETLDKFAELIVAECLVTLDSIVCDTSGERDTLWVARKVVADHFGVEE